MLNWLHCATDDVTAVTMAPPDATAAKRTPIFSGEPAPWATPPTRFVGYALLSIKGVDGLHALEDDDKTT